MPEAHNCIKLPDRSWDSYKKMTKKDVEKNSNLKKYISIIGVICVIALIIYYLIFF